MDRRYFLAGAACTVLGACTGTIGGPLAYAPGEGSGVLVPASNEPYTVKPVRLSDIPQQYRRQIVRDAAGDGYRWSSIVLGIAKSPAFLMRTSAAAS